MAWHYQIRKRIINGEPWHEIVEVYGKPFGATVDGITPGSETRRGLIEELERMLRDARKYRTLKETP